jgi:integrase
MQCRLSCDILPGERGKADLYASRFGGNFRESTFHHLMAKTTQPAPSEEDEEKKPVFHDRSSAMVLPAPEPGRPYIDYAHVEHPKFKVRVYPPDSSGRVLRQWAIRVKFTINGKTTEDRSTFGQLAKLEANDVVVTYQEGLRRALNRLSAIKQLKSSPELAAEDAKHRQRMTVAQAWARHEVETRLQRSATTRKEASHYRTYYAHLADIHLDELTYKGFWSVFVHGLAQGKLLNADQLTWSKLSSRRAEATIIGIINLGSKLYGFAHAAEGLPGKPKGWNPAAEARKLLGTPNKRNGSIPLNKIAEVWRAADVLCSSWARDHLRVYLLTGLRHSLLAHLQFSEVDTANRVLRVSPHKPGTKRHGSKTPANATDIVLPICATALRIIEARRQWAPDPNGPVWYAVSQPGGKRKAEMATNSDPRTNWAHLENRVLGGLHFARHDLRRTFARIAVRAGADLMGTSLLMLHSPRTVAKVLNLPDVTADYMNLPEAQEQMRSASNAIERFVKGLLEGTVDLTPTEPELPALLEEAVGFED